MAECVKVYELVIEFRVLPGGATMICLLSDRKSPFNRRAYHGWHHNRESFYWRWHPDGHRSVIATVFARALSTPRERRKQLQHQLHVGKALITHLSTHTKSFREKPNSRLEPVPPVTLALGFA